MALSLAERLVEAEGALHGLLTGQAVVQVTDQSGESVRFAQTSVSRLRAYVAQLRAEVAGARPTPVSFRYNTMKGY